MKTVFILIVNLFILQNVICAQNKLIKLANDLEIYQIRENYYSHTSYMDWKEYKNIPANGLIFIKNNKAMIAETPWTNAQTKILINYVRDSLNAEIEFLVPTHWHDDCLGGLEQASKMEVPSFILDITCNIIEEKNLPKTTFCFSDSISLKVAGENVEIKYLGGGHTIDNTVVWFPEDKVLFGGCMVKSLSNKSLGNTADADLKQWPNTLKKLLENFSDAEIVIPGHGRYGGTELIEHSIKLFE